MSDAETRYDWKRFWCPREGRMELDGTGFLLEATWEPVEQDRAAIFAELRRRGHPDIMRLLAEKGEDAIPNPEILLFHGALEEDPLDPTGPDPGAAATSGANRSTPA